MLCHVKVCMHDDNCVVDRDSEFSDTRSEYERKVDRWREQDDTRVRHDGCEESETKKSERKHNTMTTADENDDTISTYLWKNRKQLHISHKLHTYAKPSQIHIQTYGVNRISHYLALFSHTRKAFANENKRATTINFGAKRPPLCACMITTLLQTWSNNREHDWFSRG